MLNRMKETVDNILRQNQAGFRKGRWCCEQVFTLRKIIENVKARDRSIYRVAQINIPHRTKRNFSTTVWDFYTQIS